MAPPRSNARPISSPPPPMRGADAIPSPPRAASGDLPTYRGVASRPDRPDRAPSPSYPFQPGIPRAGRRFFPSLPTRLPSRLSAYPKRKSPCGSILSARSASRRVGVEIRDATECRMPAPERRAAIDPKDISANDNPCILPPGFILSATGPAPTARLAPDPGTSDPGEAGPEPEKDLYAPAVIPPAPVRRSASLHVGDDRGLMGETIDKCASPGIREPGIDRKRGRDVARLHIAPAPTEGDRRLPEEDERPSAVESLRYERHENKCSAPDPTRSCARAPTRRKAGRTATDRPGGTK